MKNLPGMSPGRFCDLIGAVVLEELLPGTTVQKLTVSGFNRITAR